jgi:7-carboxy-7-deazaguanine synthase
LAVFEVLPQPVEELHITPEPQTRSSARSLRLIELYRSVQGESSFAGVPCIFVRLAGCNLRCSWCDSEYTFTGGQPFTNDEIVAQIEALQPCKLVEFTGGEPMLQARELLPLMQRLLDAGYELMMETSGERLLTDVPQAVHKIVDVKCPGSGMGHMFRFENLQSLTARDEVKFVLLDRTDYEFARDFIRTHDLVSKCGHILLSPAFHKNASDARSAENMALDPRDLVTWMLDDGLPARLSLQIHKFIWEPRKKGV